MDEEKDLPKYFCFYPSYYTSIKNLDRETQLDCLLAIIQYGLFREVPKVEGFPAAYFELVKPTIDKAFVGYINGKKGGRPTETDSKPNRNPTKTESKPNRNRKRKKENETETENEKENETETENEKRKSLSAEHEDDFEEFWMEYPKHVDKKAAHDCFMTRIADGFSPQCLIKAAQNYCTEVYVDGYERRFIKSPKTFLSEDLCFLDYSDEEE